MWCSLGAGWGCDEISRRVYLRRGCRSAFLGRGLGGRRQWMACTSVAEGVGLCSLGEGWRGDDGSLRPHLLPRVQCYALWAWARRAVTAASGCICRRGCGIVLLGCGLGGLRRWLARASASEGAMLCFLGASYGGCAWLRAADLRLRVCNAAPPTLIIEALAVWGRR